MKMTPRQSISKYLEVDLSTASMNMVVSLIRQNLHAQPEPFVLKFSQRYAELSATCTTMVKLDRAFVWAFHETILNLAYEVKLNRWYFLNGCPIYVVKKDDFGHVSGWYATQDADIGWVQAYATSLQEVKFEVDELSF